MGHVHEGQERMIGTAGRKTTTGEANYPSMKVQLAAIVFGLRKYEHILRFRKFIINTDSGSLKYLQNIKNPKGMLYRWLMEIQSYDFEIRHRPGKLNLNADALSRYSYMQEPE